MSTAAVHPAPLIGEDVSLLLCFLTTVLFIHIFLCTKHMLKNGPPKRNKTPPPPLAFQELIIQRGSLTSNSGSMWPGQDPEDALQFLELTGVPHPPPI